MPRTAPPRRRRQRGLTLVEAAIALAVVAILAGLAVPSFESMRQRRHVEGVALQFETDVHFARSLAVARHQTVRISFDAAQGAGCYVVHTGAANACTCGAGGAPVCTGGAEALRAVRLDGPGVPTLGANVRSMAFDPTRGTVTPTGTVRVRYADGPALHQVVNVMGRVRSCAPAPGLAGHRDC